MLPPGLEDVFLPEVDGYLAVIDDPSATPSAKVAAAHSLRDAAGLVGEEPLREAAVALANAVEAGAEPARERAREGLRRARAAIHAGGEPALDDELDLAPLRLFFLDEAHEHLEAIARGLLDLERPRLAGGAAEDHALSEADSGALVGELFRKTHTLKGSAATVGMQAVSEGAHWLEERFERLRDGRTTPAELDIDALLAAVDVLRECVDAANDLDARQALPRLAALLGVAAPPAVPDEHQTAAAPGSAPPATSAAQDPPRAERQLVRVEVGRIDRLMNTASELLFDRTRIERRVQEVKDLLRDLANSRRALRGLEPRLRSPRLSEIEVELATAAAGLERATASLVDDVQALRRTSTDLQDGIAQVRVTPVHWLFSRLERPVREAARAEGKRVQFRLLGGETELDKTLADAIADPLLQLVRNAVVHGIETLEVRAGRGKPVDGLLEVRARPEGDSVVLEVDDDGAGIDPKQVRGALVRSGRMRADEAARIGDDELLPLIFLPGVSTRSDRADQLAGRGVGLDVVREAIARVGGDLSVTSRPGLGTRFTLRLPLTTAITSAILVKVGGQVYAFSHAAVLETVNLEPGPPGELIGTTEHRGERVPVIRLGRLLGGDALAGRRVPGVVLRHGERRVIAACDRLIGSREIVVKSLGPILAPLGIYAGATISGAGKVQLILDVGALAALTLRHPSASRGPAGSPPGVAESPQPGPPRVLLADDSRTIREAVARILSGAGYRVDVVPDGWEALARLTEGRYDLLVTDLEMPGLDGYELMARVRRSPALQALPILVLSSRTGDENRVRAEAAGASGFIGKPLSRRLVLDRVRGLLATASGG